MRRASDNPGAFLIAMNAHDHERRIAAGPFCISEESCRLIQADIPYLRLEQ